jgi:hypothetical protein
MEEFITSYGINFEHFRSAMDVESVLVAGSVALAGFLKQEGIDPGFQPNDLDIFIYGCPAPFTDSDGKVVRGKYKLRMLEVVMDLMQEWGFKANDKFAGDGRDNTYMLGLNRIQKILSFTNGAGKEIQVIVLNNPVILDYIETNFDLSACASWWNPKTNTFETFDPYYTRRKEIYIMRDSTNEDRRLKDMARIEKYVARGFKHIDIPCPYIDKPDARIIADSITKFDNLTAYDIFTLEDIPLKSFIEGSSWNIVLKSGDNYYAFNRKQLQEYMLKTCSFMESTGESFFDTPFNQSINIKSYCSLIYSDFTIYELKSSHTVTVEDGKQKSLFFLYCYNVEQWIIGKPGKIVPPTRQQARNNYVEATVEDIIAAYTYLRQTHTLDMFHAAIYG